MHLNPLKALKDFLVKKIFIKNEFKKIIKV